MKLSALSPNSSPALADFFVMVKANLTSDVRVTVQNMISLLATAGLQTPTLAVPTGGVNGGWSSSTYITAATGGSITFTSTLKERIYIRAPFTYATNTNGTGFNTRLQVDGVTASIGVPSFGGPAINPGMYMPYTLVTYVDVDPGSHTVTFQGATQGAGTFTVYHTLEVVRYNHSS